MDHLPKEARDLIPVFSQTGKLFINGVAKSRERLAIDLFLVLEYPDALEVRCMIV